MSLLHRLILCAFVLPGVLAISGPGRAEGTGENQSEIALKDCDQDHLADQLIAPGVAWAGDEGNVGALPCFPTGIQQQTLAGMPVFALNGFAGINWPAGPGRGVPDDKTTPALAAASSGDYVTVWDGWRSTSDIFRSDGGAPLPWDAATPDLPAACKGLSLTDEVRKEFLWADVPGGEDAPLHVLGQYRNPDGFMLVDKAGQPVRYEVLFNRQAQAYVADNRLWSLPDLEGFIAEHHRLRFPEGTWSGGPGGRGAIVVKAAWKILDQAWDDPRHFHKAWAYVTPIVRNGMLVDQCKIVPVGLVGLHVAFKLESQPGWLWSTFEHAAVAPGWSDMGTDREWYPPIYGTPGTEGIDRQPKTLTYLFYAPQAPCGTDDCQAQTHLNQPGSTSRADLPLMPSRIIDTQRFTRPETENCLDCKLPTLAGFEGSSIAFYFLKGAQWVTDSGKKTGDEPKIRRIEPEILSNAAIESFSQDRSSCQSCHRGAGTPPPGDPGFVEDPLRPVFDYIFAFQHINGMPRNGTLPLAIPPADQ